MTVELNIASVNENKLYVAMDWLIDEQGVLKLDLSNITFMMGISYFMIYR
jgi:hypothetical protein